ncbi:MAG: hypothetical protein KAW12_21100 [Candidatus Aminicenantes bacterium]|nr:hypothetical protein [Candidatus Aminicenantes bacterium]
MNQNENGEKAKPIGWNLSVDAKAQLYKIAAFLHVKRSHAVLKMFDMLFSKLVEDREFKEFVAAFNRIDRTKKIGNAYTSFFISPGYMKKFKDVMYDFGFVDRSPFLRLIIDYVYNHIVEPIEAFSIPKVRGELEKLGYKIKSIGPILEGDIYIQVENPLKKAK